MDFTYQPSVSEPVLAPSVSSGSASTRYRFADCFAGLGGFHVALERLGHECVFSCELDEELRKTYEHNFGIQPVGDIRQVMPESMPAHEILCAGFPCQPFSLAGKKKGAACPESGKLIDDVFRLVRHHRQRYVFLENVPNVLTIADGSFWKSITKNFARLGYRVEHRIYSPLQFGIPQQRLRLFVVARREDTPDFEWPEPTPINVRPLSDFVDSAEESGRRIEPAKMRILEKWNEFLALTPEICSHTILASEFGATYPLEGFKRGRPWRHYKGGFGKSLERVPTIEAAVDCLPHYAADNGGVVPEWMRRYVTYSRWLYEQAPSVFDRWKEGVEKLPNSWQKLEWRSDKSVLDIWRNTIQFRASGIRVMRPEMAPSLVAMTPTQTPIIGAKRRYINVREAASLQALEGLSTFPEGNARAFKALGNAVNAKIVYEIAKVVLI